MGGCFFEPTATKMATIPLDKAASAIAREEHPPSRQPPNSPQASMADAWAEWFGENLLNIGKDITISEWQPPHQNATAPTSWKEPSEPSLDPQDSYNPCYNKNMSPELPTNNRGGTLSTRSTMTPVLGKDSYKISCVIKKMERAGRQNYSLHRCQWAYLSK